MRDLIKSFIVFLWKRDSESAVCVIIFIAQWMTKRDLSEMGDYLYAYRDSL